MILKSVRNRCPWHSTWATKSSHPKALHRYCAQMTTLHLISLGCSQDLLIQWQIQKHSDSGQLTRHFITPTTLFSRRIPLLPTTHHKFIRKLYAAVLDHKYDVRPRTRMSYRATHHVPKHK